jgi:hypothetical protein
MIRSTRRFSSSPAGCNSALRLSSSSRKASPSSPGKSTSFERRSCFSAFRLAATFPSGVFGPVLFTAFWRLASIFFSLVIVVYPPISYLLQNDKRGALDSIHCRMGHRCVALLVHSIYLTQIAMKL